MRVDHEKRELHYAIPRQPIEPVENIVGQMKVRPGKDTGSIIEWQWTFDVDEANEATAREMLAGMGKMGIEGIEELILSSPVSN